MASVIPLVAGAIIVLLLATMAWTASLVILWERPSLTHTPLLWLAWHVGVIVLVGSMALVLSTLVAALVLSWRAILAG